MALTIMFIKLVLTGSGVVVNVTMFQVASTQTITVYHGGYGYAVVK